MDNKEFEEKIFELATYAVVSARNLLEEPARYGPFRLVDTVSRLVEILETADMSSERLEGLGKRIEDGKYTAMGTEAEYRDFLESLVSFLVEEIGREGKQ